MSGYPKNFPGDVQLGVIAGGDITDPPSDHSSNQRVLSPLEHGDEVELEHLNFSPMSHSPTGFSQQWFHGALDPGTVVYALKTMGQGQVQILGQANDVQNGGSGSGGGFLMNGKVQELLNRSIQINTPPKIKEAEDRGAKVRVISEQGKQHSRSLLDGLPTHGALFDMSGWKIPQLKEVATAKQEYSQIQTNDMLGALGGELMSMGGVMQGLMSKLSATKGAGGGGGAGGGVGGGAQNISSGTYTDFKGQLANPENGNVFATVAYANGNYPIPEPIVTTQTANINATVSFAETDGLILIGNTAFTRDANTFNDSYEYDGDPGKLGKAYSRHANLINEINGYDPKLVSRVANTGYVLATGAASNVLANFEGTYLDYYGENSDITRMDIIMNSIPHNMRLAMNSLSLLTQGVEGSNILSYTTANRVHLETYLDHACDLFSQVTCIDDLMRAMKRLHNDESLFGLDKIPDKIIDVETGWGSTTANVSANGLVSINYTKEQLESMNASYQMMTTSNTNPSSFNLHNANTTNATIGSGATSGGSSGGGSSGGGGGGGQGGNMFGQSASTMFDMFKRMAPDAEKQANKLMKSVSEGQEHKDMWKIVQATLQGGDPIGFDFFKG